MSTSTESHTLPHPNGQATVEFHWSNDRFDHYIRIGELTLRSIAGSAQDTWPASPPLQQLSLEEIESREIAFGVGLAGTSHWSVSVEPTEDGFRFDWACRTKEPPGFLGTTYEPNVHFEFRAGEASALNMGSAAIVVTPEDSTHDSAGTARWSYEVAVAKNT